MKFNSNGEHIDLFMYRQKSQNEFKSVIGNKDDLNEFGKKQLALCHELILELEPRVMVVVNAFASNLIAKTWFLKEEFSEEIGTYICTLNDKKVPLFFSSMVSGQRALDNHSLKRLIWHIKYALKKIEGREIGDAH